MKNRKKWIGIAIFMIVLIVIIVFIVGRSFGFFRYIREGEIVNIIKINGIEVDILNKDKDALNLTNKYPVYDEEGLTYTPFEFTVTNTTSRDLTYQVKIVSDTEQLSSCTLEDGSPCEELTTDNIKFVYKQDEEAYTEPAILKNEDKDKDGVIATVVIPAKESITHSIILWIKNDANEDIVEKYFYGKVILEGTAVENTD